MPFNIKPNWGSLGGMDMLCTVRGDRVRQTLMRAGGENVTIALNN